MSATGGRFWRREEIRLACWARQSLDAILLPRSGLTLARALSTNTHSTGRWMRPRAKLARPRRRKTPSPSKSHALGKKRYSRHLRLLHGSSHCAPPRSSPQARVAFTGSCEASRDGGWEAPLPVGTSSFPGFTKLIFATLSNG